MCKATRKTVHYIILVYHSTGSRQGNSRAIIHQTTAVSNGQAERVKGHLQAETSADRLNIFLKQKEELTTPQLMK